MITDRLFELIKSLSKSEKRSFKLYAKRVQGEQDRKFIQLFDAIDKQKVYDEEKILQKVPDIKRQQVSNLKRHLYGQILTSLRPIYSKKDITIEIREQIDFAYILYYKGLYFQALKLLDRIKQYAINSHQDTLHLEIIEFEKRIESRHITRSIENRAEALSEESFRRQQIIGSVHQLTNLCLKLYGLYIKIGHVKSEKDAFIVNEFFKANMPQKNIDSLTFFEKVYAYQAYVWYYYILLDFPLCYRYAQRWVDLFEANPLMKNKDVVLYMRGHNNLLTALFQLGYQSKFVEYLDIFGNFIEVNKDKFSPNAEVFAFLYYYTALINRYFLEGRFSEGLTIIPTIENKLNELESKVDEHRVLVFYYKIACMYFSSGDNGMAIDYLNKIINSKAGGLREDIQCYARMLHLIAHYELEHYGLLEYLVKSVYRFLKKMEDLNLVQKEVLLFLRKALYSNPNELTQLFIKLRNKLEKLVVHPYEKRSFTYLDIISWLESKIQNRPVQDVIREKFITTKR